MATDFQSEMGIDEMTKSLVSGYLRKLNVSQQLMAPPLVIRLCLLYFYDPDYFEAHGVAIQLREDNTLATARYGHSNMSVYGNMKINNAYPRAVYQWKFKIINNVKFNTAIGICSTTRFKNKWFTRCITKDSDEEFYAFGYQVLLTKK